VIPYTTHYTTAFPAFYARMQKDKPRELRQTARINRIYKRMSNRENQEHLSSVHPFVVLAFEQRKVFNCVFRVEKRKDVSNVNNDIEFCLLCWRHCHRHYRPKFVILTGNRCGRGWEIIDRFESRLDVDHSLIVIPATSDAGPILEFASKRLRHRRHASTCRED